MKFRKTRQDNKRLAPCLKYSMWHCYRYRHVVGECLECRLVNDARRISKIVRNDGKEMARCAVCGRMFPLSEFTLYKRVFYDDDGNGKVCYNYIYRCTDCTRAAVRKSQEKKRLNQSKDANHIMCIDNCRRIAGINNSDVVYEYPKPYRKTRRDKRPDEFADTVTFVPSGDIEEDGGEQGNHRPA